MAHPKTTKTPVAVDKFTELDLSCQHITTSNFMEFNAAKFMELVPHQSVDIDMTTFTRLAPMQVPTFGNASIHNRAYFVPYRTIMRGWDEFINDTTYITGTGQSVIPRVPQLTNAEIVNFLSLDECSSVVADVDDVYDFTYVSSDGATITNRKFTTFGKYAYKLLCSLGYRVFFNKRAINCNNSALPLFSLMRVFFDWYFPSAYVDDERADIIRRYFNSEVNTVFVQSRDLLLIFQELYRVSYDTDYFVAAWDNPAAPNSGAYSPVTINDPTDGMVPSLATETNGTPRVKSTYNLTQFADTALHALSDYMRRNQIAGARVLDRFYSRWGIKLEAAKLNRSVYFGFNESKLQFGDVTSTADTDGAGLGSYAGKGVGYNQKTFSFSTDEFGALIIISTIVPKAAYYQGAYRPTFHLSKFDFYTPEFDCLGVQALSSRELYVPTVDYTEEVNVDNAVFGFVPRYAEYKVGHDNMTGDIVLPSRNSAKEGWSLMRDVSPYFEGRRYDEVVHGQDFVDGQDAAQYNRIFDIVDDYEDKFNVIHNFNITSRFPGRSLYDSYEYMNEDRAQKVDIDINGVKAN